LDNEPKQGEINMKHRTRTSLAALFVAVTLVALALNYSSPTATRTISSKGLYTFAPSCSTMITLPLVGTSYTKPDSIIFQISVRAPLLHAAPLCSVFGRGTYGSYITTDWTPWTFMFAVDSGASWREVGRPWAAFDFVWLKFKLSGSDTCVLNATLKYLGELAQATSVTSTPPFNLRYITPPCTLDNANDYFIVNSTNSGRIWLPPAALRTRPITVTTSLLPKHPDSLWCQGLDAFYIAVSPGNPVPALIGFGDQFTLISDGNSRWSFAGRNF
jgi:hypothetical protein